MYGVGRKTAVGRFLEIAKLQNLKFKILENGNKVLMLLLWNHGVLRAIELQNLSMPNLCFVSLWHVFSSIHKRCGRYGTTRTGPQSIGKNGHRINFVANEILHFQNLETVG